MATASRRPTAGDFLGALGHCVAKQIGSTNPTGTKALQKLESLGFVHEITGGNYARLYAYSSYLQILTRDAEPLER